MQRWATSMAFTGFADFGLCTLTRCAVEFAGTLTLEEIGIAFAKSRHHLAGANFAVARRGVCGGVVRGSRD